MTLQIFGAPKNYSLEKPQKSAQLTQLRKLSWVEERSHEKSREVQGFLFDQSQTGGKVKVLIKTFWESNVDIDW